MTIVVPPELKKLPGFVVTRNGTPLQSAAWDTELPVDPGKVEVVETATGYKPKTLYTTLSQKQHASLTLEGLELAPIVKPPTPFWTGRRTSGVIVAGAGVAFAAVGAVFGVSSINSKKNSDSNCPVLDGDYRCNQAGADDMSKARTDAWVSDLGFGLAAVGIVGGAILFFGGGNDEEGAAPPGTVTLGASGWSMKVGAGPRAAEGFLFRSF